MIELKELKPQKITITLTNQGEPYDGKASFRVVYNYKSKDEKVVFDKVSDVVDGKLTLDFPAFKENDYIYLIETEEGHTEPEEFIVFKSSLDTPAKETYTIELDELVKQNKDVLGEKANEFFEKNAGRLKQAEKGLEERKREREEGEKNILKALEDAKKENLGQLGQVSLDIQKQIDGVDEKLDEEISSRKSGMTFLEKMAINLSDSKDKAINALKTAYNDAHKLLEKKIVDETSKLSLEISNTSEKIIALIPKGGILDYTVNDEIVALDNLWSSVKITDVLRGLRTGNQGFHYTTDIDDSQSSAETTYSSEYIDANFGAGTVGPGTINEIAYFDTADTIASLAVATYPSLTELSYVKGVTSAIQTQLNAKLASTFTKAALDTAVTDGNVLYVGDVTSNATHTGEVTGSGALTVDKTAITGKTLVSAAVGDHVLVADASDSDNLKKVTVQTIVDLASGGGATTELDNLGTTAINAALIPDSDDSYGLGDHDKRRDWLCTDQIRTGRSTGNAIYIQARDVNDTIYRSMFTVTAGNVPTGDLATEVTIGSQYIYRAGGTDIPLADGGTGASLADPGADRVMARDDSAGAVKFIPLADLTDEPSPAAGDYLLAYGAEGDLRKVDWSELPGAGSGITRTVVTTSGSLTLGATAATDYLYFVAGAHTLSMPDPNTNRYTIKNNHSANITIDTAGAETIEGAASISLAPEAAVDVVSDGTNRFII